MLITLFEETTKSTTKILPSLLYSHRGHYQHLFTTHEDTHFFAVQVISTPTGGSSDLSKSLCDEKPRRGQMKPISGWPPILPFE